VTVPAYGGALYRDRPGTSTLGQTYLGNPDGSYGNTGLVGNVLNNYWEGQGFELIDTDGDPSNDLEPTTGDSLYVSPDPNDLAGFLNDGSGVNLSYYVDQIPQTTGVPTHLTGSFGTPDATETSIAAGIVTNRWATHELYWVDDTFTYVIDDVPVLQITPDNDGLNGDDNVYDDFSDSGTVVLGFFDRFSSIANSPEGSNFVVYDNLSIESAASGDAPELLAYLGSEGYLLDGPSIDGDYDGTGQVGQGDLDLVLLNWGADTPPIPEGWVNQLPVGQIDQAELDGVLLNWGSGGPELAGAATVPEPGSVALVTLAGLCLSFARRKL